MGTAKGNKELSVWTGVAFLLVIVLYLGLRHHGAKAREKIMAADHMAIQVSCRALIHLF